MNTPNPNFQLSKLRQKLAKFIDEHRDLAWRMANTDPVIPGSFYMVHKTCSQPNCRCHKGHKHGPFPALSQSIKGKRRLIMVRRADTKSVETKAAAYKSFQKRLQRLRKVAASIDTILTRIRELQTQEYP